MGNITGGVGRNQRPAPPGYDGIPGYEYDSHGHATCGHDFMAGTICTLPPHHAGAHAAYCQTCGGDWYDGSCTCGDCDCNEWLIYSDGLCRCGHTYDEHDEDGPCLHVEGE